MEIKKPPNKWFCPSETSILPFGPEKWALDGHNDIMETMDRPKLEHFAATYPKGYVEIVLDDGSILVGKNFGYFIKGQKLDLWGIRQDDGVTSVISGLCIKKIRGI